MRMDAVEAGVEQHPRLPVGRIARDDDVALEGPGELPVDPRRRGAGELGQRPGKREYAGSERDATSLLQQLPAGHRLHLRQVIPSRVRQPQGKCVGNHTAWDGPRA